MSEWQDISTAPKDGTIILIYIQNERGLTGTLIASWDSGDDLGDDLDDDFEPAWHIAYSEEWFDAPTHWMPLPGPPK